MVKEREKYELFEDYLKGTLEDSRRKDFESQLSKSSALKTEFEQYQEMHQIIFESGLGDIRAELSKIHSKQTSVKRIRKGFRNGFIIVAAITTGFILFKNLNRQKSENIIQAKQSKLIQTIDSIPNKIVIDTPVEKSDLSNKTIKETTLQPIIQIKKKLYEQIENEKIENIAKSVNNSLSTIYDSTTPDSVLEENVTTDSQTDARQIEKSHQKIDCDEINITSKYQKQDVCIEGGLGQITFLENTVSGGQAPYYYSINLGKTYTSFNDFKNLNVGLYHLKIKDANNCVGEVGDVELFESLCEKDIIIAPYRNEYWSIPFKTGVDGTLYIYSKNGVLMYSSQIGDGYNKIWQGKSLDGNYLPLGIYIYRLIYNDDSQFEGTITVVK